MVEAKNFVEKELGKNLDDETYSEEIYETKAPMYTPPSSNTTKKAIEIGWPSMTQIPQTQTIQQPIIQIVEKIVYKRQRIHGFFRTLTIIALLAIGFLMLGESTGLISLSINSFKLHQIFPLGIILSSIIIRSYKGIFGKIFGLILFMTVFWWIFTIGIYTSLNPTSKRKSGNTVSYDIPKTTTKSPSTNIYIETFIGNSYIEGKTQNRTIQWTRKSDRNLLVFSWESTGNTYIKLYEDRNRNIIQNYVSTIDFTLPNNSLFDLIYIKNFLWLHTIDLNTFQRKTLKFHAGIDDITIKVGNVLSGNKIEVQGVAANITLDIPKDIGVIMYYKHIIGKFVTTDFDSLSWNYFQSKNIATAKSILNMYINLWVGNTKINRVDAK